MTDAFMNSRDGLRLRRRSWLPEGASRATVVIAHGYGEYAGRYAGFASPLIAAGYRVEGIDARGHGESEGSRVWIDAIDDLAIDLGDLCEQLLLDDNRPLFVLGHSLGSLVAIRTVLERQEKVAGLILSGNALDGQRGLPGTAVFILRLLARLLPGLRLLPALRAEDLSTDPSVVNAYCEDPLVDRGRWRLVTASAIMTAIAECRDGMVELRTPLLIIHGANDRMLSPEGARFAMQHAGSADKTLSVYPGEYHEVLSGLTKNRVTNELVQWLDLHTDQ